MPEDPSMPNTMRKKNLTGDAKFSKQKTPGSVSFPFLSDAGQIFGMLMGQDATLLRYDAGEMSATAVLGLASA